MRILPAALVLAVLCAGCAHKRTDLYTYVPEGTNMLAGANLDRVRESSLTAAFPAFQSLVERFKEGHYLVTAFRGTEVLEIERGPFAAPPAGMKIVEAGVALQGPASLVQAAETQHASGMPGSQPLVAHASSADVWFAIQRGTQLPLAGNLVNLNRFFQKAEYTTLELKLDIPVEATLTMYTATSGDAVPLEQELRAAITMASAGEEEYGLWKSARIRRDENDRHVRIELLISLPDLQRLYSFSIQGK